MPADVHPTPSTSLPSCCCPSLLSIYMAHALRCAVIGGALCRSIHAAARMPLVLTLLPPTAYLPFLCLQAASDITLIPSFSPPPLLPFPVSKDARFVLRHDEALSHRIYAASDMILIPSAFEPCGLTQLISLRYGTIPIVRETGGLVDTVGGEGYV